MSLATMLKSKVFMKKTKRGSIIKIVREHYLRDDIVCGSPLCGKCPPQQDEDEPMDTADDDGPATDNNKRKWVQNFLTENHATTFNDQSEMHYLIPDTNVVLHQVDILEEDSVKNVVILSTVLEEVRNRSLTIYKRLRDLISNPDKHFYVFVNEHHFETYVERVKGETANDRNDKAIRVAAHWYNKHLSDLSNIKIILLTNDKENKRLALIDNDDKLQVFTIREYVDQLTGRGDLIDKLAYLEKEQRLTPADKFEYPSHLSDKEMKSALLAGSIKQGTFHSSRENYLEGEVMVEGREQPVFIQGRMSLNRAVHDDIVAIEMLPESQWSCPSSLILEDAAVDGDAKDDQDEAREVKRSVNENARPTAKVVGIVKRRWRQYCGMLQPSKLIETNRHLFVAAERRIPKVRIETRQADTLSNKRIIVAIDSWPRHSKYPQGHFVRVLGEIGDKATENEVLLLEHDIPHTAFSQRVLQCLPSENWSINKEEEARRTDLRHLTVCSVDPPGCTDIDDALHCRLLDNGNYEVGVHIADVTHFVRPGTALDLEAANRGTTVYLTDRRIDMVPELLSSNLCSLRSKVERLAFSVLWEVDAEANVISSSFTKSIILSKASLTYAAAQAIIDDSQRNDDIAKGLRKLNEFAKVMKKRRVEAGALSLASPEIRFEVDSETHDPIDVQEKQTRDTNSMVEEFMLLANVTVGQKIYDEFAQCALLRRHPQPPHSNFDPVLSVCRAYGFDMDVTSNKTLASSLDKALLPDNPYFNTMLRILSTRCMMQAQYFCSGMMPENDFYHYGLAMKIYTHFTSPIRRYSDVMAHRLLAVSIGADASYPDLLDKHKTQALTNNLNYRHKMAQYASRASVGLHTQLFFKTRVLSEQGYVLTVRKNALQVLIPKYGLEGTLYLDVGDLKCSYDEEACTQTVSGHVFHIFDPVMVQLSLDSTNVQHQKLQMRLVKPQVNGLSIEDSDEVEITDQPKKIRSAVAASTKPKSNKKEKLNKKR